MPARSGSWPTAAGEHYKAEEDPNTLGLAVRGGRAGGSRLPTLPFVRLVTSTRLCATGKRKARPARRLTLPGLRSVRYVGAVERHMKMRRPTY